MIAKLRRQLTADGSETFHNMELDEGYHSISGAAEEARLKFSVPCRIGSLALKGQINILDICFGLGYNTAAAIDMALGVNPSCRITIRALENDRAIMEMAREVAPPFNSYSIVRDAISLGEIQCNGISIKLYEGDAREEVKKTPDNWADAVFLDPFSPKKSPHMWDYDFLSDIQVNMKPGAGMATYSCASIVRRNLRDAGFVVSDTDPVGRKSPGTLAIKP